jgi:Transposase zinc-ribbon domain
MAQHFLTSAAARSLSPAKVMRMSELEAENVFARLRWPQTDGKLVCPMCNCRICYDCRRSPDRARWRCKACRTDFSVTSGTLFAWHKLPLRTYLMAIVVFCNEVKGKACSPSPATSTCNTRLRSFWRTSCARRWRPAPKLCASAVMGARPKSTAPISVVIAVRRIWLPIASTGG